MQHSIRPHILCLGLLIGGCASLPNKTIPFKGLSDCPRQTPAELLATAQNIGPGSSTHTLQCSLTIARETQDTALLGSALPARLALHLAERSTSATEQESLTSEGIRLAEQALKLGGSGDGAVHYYLAANLGLAIHDHPLQAAASLPRLEQESQKALHLSPAVDHGGPLRLLGMLYLKAPPWPTGIGDGDKALELLQKAAREYPEHPLNHLFFAQALWEVDENGERARSELAMGHQKLTTGAWGYNKAIWQASFAEVEKELGTASDKP